MALRMLSSAVAKRFPSYQHLVQVLHKIDHEYRNDRLASWLRRSSNDSKWWRSSLAMLDIRLVVIINNMAAVIIIIILIGMTIFVTIVIVIFNWVWSDHLDSNSLGSKAPSTSLERGTHLWGTSLSRSQQVQQLWSTPRHEICQKFYTTGFSCQKFYTLPFTEFQQFWW